MGWDRKEAVDYYRRQGAPGDQSALLSLLRELQTEYGGSIPASELADLARELGVKESFLIAVIRRIPSLRLCSSHILELCAGPNCTKRAALSAFVQKTYGADPKSFTLKYVPCMRMCGKGPNVKWDGKLYHQADEALIRKLVDSLQNSES